MSDMNLLLFGIVVFGLMLAGVVMTVVEFRQLSSDKASGLDPRSDSPDSKRR